MRHFCIDIDNVVARTDEVMREVIADVTACRVNLAYEDIKNFNYHECLDGSGHGITKSEWAVVHDLFSEPRYLWRIRPVAGAVDGLRQLADHGTIHFATSRLAKARRTTVEWLENYEFPAHDLHFLRYGEKHASLRPFLFAVEDDYDQGAAFATHGATPCFLISHPWNHRRPAIDGLQWVDSWPELLISILEMLDGTT